MIKTFNEHVAENAAFDEQDELVQGLDESVDGDDHETNVKHYESGKKLTITAHYHHANGVGEYVRRTRQPRNKLVNKDDAGYELHDKAKKKD